MFLRYVVPSRDENSHRLSGVFGAAYRLHDRGHLGGDVEKAFADLFRWFNSHLPVPDRLSRSRRRGACPKAICWFKEDAAEPLLKVRELAALLDWHGIRTRELRTGRPGYVVYEDAFQIAAVPFRDTDA